jgi:beta-N-acetylhexosaminidase
MGSFNITLINTKFNTLKNYFLKSLDLVLFTLIIIVVLYYRDTGLATYRNYIRISIWLVLAFWALFRFRQWREWIIKSYLKKSINSVMVLLQSMAFIFSLVLFSTSEIAQFYQKQSVLNANTNSLKNVGAHIILGYRDYQEIEEIVKKGGIGGIFISQRNVQNKTKQQLKSEIEQLQNIRKQLELPPLLVTTDFEGGIVSRLSPPLPSFPSLGQVVKANLDSSQIENKVREYSSKVAFELSEVGINVNFSTVVDLDYGLNNPTDKFSRIADRSISSDPEIVSKAASWYCQELLIRGVYCTLKHFPGLGQVYEDTHVENASLETSINELESKDWIPFRQVSNQTKTLVMVGHPKLGSVDDQSPSSFSKESLKLLRQQVSNQTLTVSDDFSMHPAAKYKEGVGKAAEMSLKYGNDLVLISFDSELYWPVMNHLLTAYETKQNTELIESLDQSKNRIYEYLNYLGRGSDY